MPDNAGKNKNIFIRIIKKAKIFTKKLPVWVTVCAALLTAIICVFGTYFAVSYDNIGKMAIKLRKIENIVNKNYYGEYEQSDLEDAVFSGYIDGIGEEYGFYKSGDDAEDVADSFEGNSNGIGVTVFKNDAAEGLQIYRIDKDSPADSAGVKPGDIIINIDGKKVSETGYSAAKKMLSKKDGEKSQIICLRNNAEISFTVTHTEFVRQTVYSRIIDSYGYICFTAFNSATVRQFNDTLEDFTAKNVKGLIFDVRDNGGGSVSSVCKILKKLVGKCNLITVEYANGKKKVLYKSDKNKCNLPMAVLTNSSTASASELFAATLRDMNKSPLIGGTTFGKGVMQKTYFLSDGSCVRITVGKFYPPSGVCFDEVGLKPDYKVFYADEQYDERYILGDSDPYIQKALEVLKK